MEFGEIVEDYTLSENVSVNDLVEQMEKAHGFTANKIATGVKTLEMMVRDPNCSKFLSFTGNLIATGMRGIFKEMIKHKLVDVIITTCGTLDHDIARSWKKYYKGSFLLNDSQLHKKNVNRLGNVLVPNQSYGTIIEDKMQKLLLELWKEGVKEVSTNQLCQEIGERICREDSILYWAAKNQVPIYVPGIMDGAVGYQIWLFSQDHNFKINLIEDSTKLNNLIFTSKKTGALIVGGGISKHHTIWWNQFKNGLDYAIYISTAVEWDGSLSGARPREAISWGKINEVADYVMIEGDASIILPLIIFSLVKRLGMEIKD
jgi:deoxyhypusine synthase